jgi:Uri superfamily endonuclease
LNQPGAYILLLRLDKGREIHVGRLRASPAQDVQPQYGRRVAPREPSWYPPGWYAYTGSAHGPGGLAARVARHLARAGGGKRVHWHVDYLREHVTVVEAWALPGAPPQMECRWAATLRALAGAEAGPSRFGASDCRCAGHLVRFAAYPRLRDGLGVRLMAVSEERRAELVAALTKGDDDAREAVVADLAELGVAVVPPLVDLLRDPDPDARWWAARALAACAVREDLDAQAALVVALNDPSPDVRACAALALGELQATPAAGALAERLGDDDALVASVASGALICLGEPAIASLLEVLRGNWPARARSLAARALGRIGGTRSVGALWEALARDPNYLVHHHAYAALEAMGELEPEILLI